MFAFFHSIHSEVHIYGVFETLVTTFVDFSFPGHNPHVQDAAVHHRPNEEQGGAGDAVLHNLRSHINKKKKISHKKIRSRHLLRSENTVIKREEKGKKRCFPQQKKKMKKRRSVFFTESISYFNFLLFPSKKRINGEVIKTYDHCRNHGRMQSRVLVNMREKKRKMQRLKFETQDPSLVVYVLLIPNSEAERWKITTEAVKKSCGRNRKGGGLTHFESQSSVFYSRRIGFLLCVVFPNHLVKKPLAIFILGGLELFLMTRFPFFPF